METHCRKFTPGSIVKHCEELTNWFLQKRESFLWSLGINGRVHSLLTTHSGQMHNLDVPNLPFRRLFSSMEEKQQKEPAMLISFTLFIILVYQPFWTTTSREKSEKKPPSFFLVVSIMFNKAKHTQWFWMLCHSVAIFNSLSTEQTSMHLFNWDPERLVWNSSLSKKSDECIGPSLERHWRKIVFLRWKISENIFSLMGVAHVSQYRGAFLQQNCNSFSAISWTGTQINEIVVIMEVLIPMRPYCWSSKVDYWKLFWVMA